MKESVVVYNKYVRLKKTTAVVSTGTGIICGGDNKHINPTLSAFEDEAFIDNGGVSYYPRAGGLHVILNRLVGIVVSFR